MAPVGSFFARSRHLALFAAFPALGLVVVVGQAVLLSGCDGGSAGAAAAATAPTVQMTQAQSAFFATHPQLKVVWDHGVGVPASMRGFTSPMVGDPAGAATRFLEGIKDVLKLGDVGAQMKVRRVQRDDLGYEHVRFSQVHEGLSVIGAEVIVHSDRLRRIYQVDTKIYPDPDVSLIPSVTAEKALARGRGDFASKKTLRVSRGPTLVVYPWGSQKTYLAWTYALSFGEPGGSIGHWIYFVDAHSGRVLTRFNDIQTIAGPTTNGTHTDVTGNRLAGEDGASVTVQGWRDDTNSAWYLYNKYENWYIYNHWHWAPTYTDDNTFAHRTANASWGTSDQALISLANNFHSIQQFCQGVLGWNSFDNLGRVAVVNGHYSETGSAFLNAFYSGDFADPTNNVTPRMFYFGDGDGVLYNPLVSLDITAHEFGHGITHHSSNLVYANESGALNESFSDIYGAACEFQVQPDGRSSYPGSQAGRADWLMGEDATVHSWATAGRDMRNPGSTTTLASGSQQPSRYHGVYWYTGTGDNGGVHRNSGPQNFVYYLLSEGGSGLNDGLPYSLTGIGWLDAARVAHRANTAYLTQGSTYGNARNAWISAATDLQGGSDWVTPVGQAFDAIGVTGVPAAVTEGFEGGTIPAGWDTSGAATWSVTTTHIEGAQAVRAGAIVDSQASHLTTTVNTTQASLLSFFIMVSSESGWDNLSFTLDGTTSTTWSGAVDWTSYAVNVPAGSHTFRWTYEKDTSTATGLDTAWLDAVTLVPLEAPTGDPSGLAATLASSTEIDLEWVDNCTTELGFRIERRDGASGTFTEIATVSANTTTTRDSGLSAGTAYTYRVRAYNAGGNTGYSNEASATTPGGATAPGAPSALSATAAGSIAVVLTWTRNSTNETGFKIERKTGSTGSYSQIGTVTANVTTCGDTGLASMTTYTYRVRAYNATGNSAFSNEASATTGASSDSSSSGCFIATAAYGSPLDARVMALRRFRDRHLVTNAWGRLLVDGYYRTSPPVADVIRRSDTLKEATRWALEPLIDAVERLD